MDYGIENGAVCQKQTRVSLKKCLKLREENTRTEMETGK